MQASSRQDLMNMYWRDRDYFDQARLLSSSRFRARRGYSQMHRSEMFPESTRTSYPVLQQG